MRRSRNDVIVQLVGQSATFKTGQLAAKTATRIGKRKGGKHDLEVIAGQEYSAAGRMVKKKRIIDRVKNLYVEKVVDAETNEVLHEVEEPLSKHVNRGSAKDRAGDG